MERTFALGACLSGLVAICLIAASFGTETWLVNSFTQQNRTECIGTRTLGLFNCRDIYVQGCFLAGSDTNSLLGDTHIDVEQALLYCVIAFGSVSMAWLLLACFVCSYNLCTRPYETYAGPVGIIFYFSAGGVFMLLTMILYIVFGFNTDELAPIPGNYYATDSDFGYSFYIFLASIAPIVLAIVLVFLSGKDVKKTVKEKLCPGSKREEKQTGGKDEIFMF